MVKFVSTSQNLEMAIDALKAFQEALKIIDSQSVRAGFNPSATMELQIDKPGSINYSRLPENTIDEYDVFLLSTALVEPENLTGVVAISLDGQQVLHVKDGQVVQDSLGLIYNQQKEQADLEGQMRATEGKRLLPYAKALLDICGQSTLDGSKRWEGNRYIFTEQGGQLTVTAKDGEREILNNEGFTELASNEDIASMQGLRVETLLLSTIPTRGLKL